MKTFKGKIKSLKENEIFIFGSNSEGRHGKGAALFAKRNFGAEYGNPKGLQGQSYAIITKDLRKKNKLRSISLEEIDEQIGELLKFANHNANLTFYVSEFGSSLAGYTKREIATLFLKYELPDNIIMNEDYGKIIFESKMDNILY